MDNKADLITKFVSEQSGLKLIKPFYFENNIIKGEIAITLLNEELQFEVEIYSFYPFQFHNTESIRFYNKNLLVYNHVNADGSICIHTTHSPDLKTKVVFDINALKQWIDRYYINDRKDTHYEHIIVNERDIDGEKSIFLFTDIDHDFKSGEYGTLQYSFLSKSKVVDSEMNTFIVQRFNCNSIFYNCCWNTAYSNLETLDGLFVYFDKPPVKNKRFTVENWIEMEEFVPHDFFKFLSDFEKNGESKKLRFTLLLVGYKISEGEIHWQSILIPIRQFPQYFRNKLYSNEYDGKFKDQKILWAQTKNISYKYFFGRGKLHDKLTDSKIAVIGIGAIGSILCKILVRGGCKDLLLVDYDFKEPENVCRSEYLFNTGLVNKVDDLSIELLKISPFVQVRGNEHLLEIGKAAFDSEEMFKVFENYFREFQIIFDCTTDNDVAYLLDKITVESEVINLSMTNHAKHLVCIVKPNLYKWMLTVFEQLENDIEDLYNPTGCWNPTFRASYNDIGSLVHFAVKQINGSYQNNLLLRNFYLTSSFEGEYKIKLSQF